MPEFDSSDYPVVGLLRCYGVVLEALRAREVVRTYNSPVGDYAEWIVANTLGLHLNKNSRAGCDAEGQDGTRYQIKGSWLAGKKSSRQLSTLRNLDKKHFDFLIAILFDKDFSIARAYRIPHSVAAGFSRLADYVGGRNLHIQRDVLAADGVEDITPLFVSRSSLPQAPQDALSPHPPKVMVRPAKVSLGGTDIPGLPKAEAPGRLNGKLGRYKVTNGNCHFANRFSSREFWWLEVPLRKFVAGIEKPIHVLLYDRQGNDLYHLQIPAAYFRDNVSSFVIRKDVDKVSLKLSIGVGTRFQDTSSGGEEMPFAQFLQD